MSDRLKNKLRKPFYNINKILEEALNASGLSPLAKREPNSQAREISTHSQSMERILQNGGMKITINNNYWHHNGNDELDEASPIMQRTVSFERMNQPTFICPVNNIVSMPAKKSITEQRKEKWMKEQAAKSQDVSPALSPTPHSLVKQAPKSQDVSPAMSPTPHSLLKKHLELPPEVRQMIKEAKDSDPGLGWDRLACGRETCTCDKTIMCRMCGSHVEVTCFIHQDVGGLVPNCSICHSTNLIEDKW